MPETRPSVRHLNAGIMTACAVGIILCYYTYIVESQKQENESYVALCDISERVSCTKAFMSDYAKGFGFIPKTSSLYLPNCIYGLIFYILVAVFSLLNYSITSLITVALGILSNIGTIYLASILYMQNNMCVICVGTYIVNAIILTLALKKHFNLFRNGTIKIKSK